MKHFQLLFLLVFLAGCGGGRESSYTSKRYFDIKEYFGKEAERLKKLNPIVEKTVSQNAQPEQRDLRISDWKAELQLFTESDINKPSWNDSYRIVKNGLNTQYISIDDNLRTKKISIRLSNKGHVRQISILNRTANTLYNSEEELDYFPDSLYRIKKHQDVRITGTTSYVVSGRFKTKIK